MSPGLSRMASCSDEEPSANEIEEDLLTEDLLTILSRDLCISELTDAQDSTSQELHYENGCNNIWHISERRRIFSQKLPSSKRWTREHTTGVDHNSHRQLQVLRSNGMKYPRKNPPNLHMVEEMQLKKSLKNDLKTVARSPKHADRKIAGVCTAWNTNFQFQRVNNGPSQGPVNGSHGTIEDTFNNYTVLRKTFHQRSSRSTPPSDATNCCQPHAEWESTAWERWLIEKEKKRRKMVEQEILNKSKLQELADKVKATQEQNKLKAMKKWEEWKDKKEKLSFEKKKTEEAVQKEKRIKERLDRDSKRANVEQRYSLWIKQKDEEAQRKMNLQKAMQSKLEESKRLRLMAAHSAFSLWLERARGKKLCVPVSYGYNDGQLISYYDRTANPRPSFVNPNAWEDP